MRAPLPEKVGHQEDLEVAVQSLGRFGRPGIPFAVAVLVVMLFGGSVRGIPFARTSPQHASESRRPRPLRHLLSSESRELKGLCRKAEEPESSPETRIPKDESTPGGCGQLPQGARIELAKPDYLRPYLASLPECQTSPPALRVRET